MKYKLDRERTLKYGMLALSLIEEKLDKPISSINMDDMRIKEIAVIIWGGLVVDDEGLTVENVMSLIDTYSSIKEATEKMGKAMSKAFGEKTEGTEQKNA